MNFEEDVKGYEGVYKVDITGRVYSTRRGKFLKPDIDKDGYEIYTLQYKGTRWKVKAHRLIANTFIPNPYDKPQVNHINGIKSDNCVDNLEWVTPEENRQHAYNAGLQKASYYRGKLKPSDVSTIRSMLKTEHYSVIAEIYNVHPETIRFIKTGRTWSHIQ